MANNIKKGAVRECPHSGYHEQKDHRNNCKQFDPVNDTFGAGV